MTNPFDPIINPEQVYPFYGFIVFDLDTKLPLYSQWTFNFKLYAHDFNLVGKSKNEIFVDFWIRNQTDFSQVYTVLPSLTKYFFRMTIKIINYMYFYAFAAHYGRLTNIIPKDAIPVQTLVQQQFDLINYTPVELSRVEDYFYEQSFLNGELIFNSIYSKYNFDFAKFSEDFKIYGPKRLIFTQFLTRNQFLSGVIVNSQTYGIAEQFKQYFNQSNYNDLINYLIVSGCGSAFPKDFKNVNNINWTAYITDNNFELTVPEAIQQWYQEGQFEQLIVKFLPFPTTELEILRNSVGILYNNEIIGSLWRVYYPDENVYVCTAFHNLPNPNTKLFLGTFENISTTGIRTTITAQFRLIGKDSIYDMAVGKFDPTLPFNVVNNVKTLDFIPPLNIDVNKRIQLNDVIYEFGVYGPISVLTATTGVVVDPNYTGPISYNFNDAKYILSQVTVSPGVSGGPQFYKDPKTNEYSCISMVVQNITIIPTLAVALTADILYEFVNATIPRWNKLVAIYGLNYDKLDEFTDLGSNKAWLGVSGNYYDKSLVNTYNKLNNLNYTGGFVISNVVQGMNFDTRQFIYNTFELNSYSTVQLFSPFDDTVIQSRLISTNAPVVIKSLSFFDSASGNYIEYNIGKYEGQDSLYKFSLGFQSIGDFFKPGSNYYEGIKEDYPRLKVNYFYYNGNTWSEDTEFIGGNGPEWFVSYTNFSQETQIVNKFRLPPFLVIYVSSIYSLFFTGSSSGLLTSTNNDIIRRFIFTDDSTNIAESSTQSYRRFEENSKGENDFLNYRRFAYQDTPFGGNDNQNYRNVIRQSATDRR